MRKNVKNIKKAQGYFGPYGGRYVPEILISALDELEKNNWLSDQRFLEQFIFAKKKKFGPRKIAHELFNKGIDEGLIEKNLSEMKQEENFLIKEIWKKKYNSLPTTNEEKLKQVRFLQSRGFDLSLIHQIIAGKDKD